MKSFLLLVWLIPFLVVEATPAGEAPTPSILSAAPVSLTGEASMPSTLSAAPVSLAGEALMPSTLSASTTFDISPMLIIRKTQAMYWENGVGVEFTHDKLFDRRLYFAASYITSRLGSAMGTNALKQDYLIAGADWRTKIRPSLWWTAGLSTGVFFVDYEDAMFSNLPATSPLMAVETGLVWKAGPLNVKLQLGYNLISGNGNNVPGSLFPVYYQLNIGF